MRILVVTMALTAVLSWTVHEIPAALHTVEGTSMLPLIRSGQLVIVNRYAYRLRDPAINDVLVFRHPDSDGLMVKRVSAIADGPLYFVTGVNSSESVDSRHFGGLLPDAIVGRVEFLGRR